MLNPPEIIKELNRTCKLFFNDSSFNLDQKTYNKFIISGDYLTTAINHYKSSQEEVKVLKWFNDFWLYLDIRFEKSELSEINTFISLSIFQGEDSDNVKKQLFRAEWDNFDNNDNRPQPHWHIYPDYSFEKTFNEFLEIADKDNGFGELLNEENSKKIDLKRMHFAMNGAWSTYS